MQGILFVIHDDTLFGLENSIYYTIIIWLRTKKAC